MFPLVDAGVIGDVNEDGALNNLDIAQFAELLIGGASSVPEPATLGLATIALAVAAICAGRRGGQWHGRETSGDRATT